MKHSREMILDLDQWFRKRFFFKIFFYFSFGGCVVLWSEMFTQFW